MINIPFIASYPKDYEFLRWCLASFRKHRGFFAPPVVCVASEDLLTARQLCREVDPEVRVVVYDTPGAPGSLRAQACMMEADVAAPGGDYYWFVGSDCCMLRPPAEEDYFTGGFPDLLYNSYEYLYSVGADVRRWQEGTSQHLGFKVDYEFMRRLPLPYCPDLLKATRDHLETVHKTHWQGYMRDVWHQGDFSESNVIGGYAYRHAAGCYNWILTDPGAIEFRKDNPMRQFWSHGGLDRPDDRDGLTPRSIYESVLDTTI